MDPGENGLEMMEIPRVHVCAWYANMARASILFDGKGDTAGCQVGSTDRPFESMNIVTLCAVEPDQPDLLEPQEGQIVGPGEGNARGKSVLE